MHLVLVRREGGGGGPLGSDVAGRRNFCFLEVWGDMSRCQSHPSIFPPWPAAEMKRKKRNWRVCNRCNYNIFFYHCFRRRSRGCPAVPTPTPRRGGDRPPPPAAPGLLGGGGGGRGGGGGGGGPGHHHIVRGRGRGGGTGITRNTRNTRTISNKIKKIVIFFRSARREMTWTWLPSWLRYL